MRMGRGLARRVSSSLSWRVAALQWCFMRLKTRSTMFRPLYASLPRSHGAARFPFVRHDRRQAERLGRQPGGTPVRAVHERARAHGPRRARCPGSDGSRRPCSRRRMPRELWYSALPWRRRRTGSPFFGAPVACRWTFTPVGSMAGTCDNYHAKLKSLTMSGSPL